MTRSRVLFAAVALLELAHAAVGLLQHRIPAGHDGFQFLTLQYYFLNNAIQAHEIPQWIPYMTQGSVATLWFSIQASMLQSVLLFAAPLLKQVDLLYAYYGGMLVDQIVLLLGTWLLAQRFFRAPAVLFVALSVVGSCVWLEQPYWNFRLYYALPLVIELGHRFLDTGRWRWALLSANLLAVQSLGNLPYCLPFTSFAVFAYFASFAAANWDFTAAALRRLQWRLSAAATGILATASFALVYACASIGTGELVSYNPGRLRDGTTTIAGFLTYGGATDARKWLDLVLNTSSSVDYTIYAGSLVGPLLLCGVVTIDRRRAHFILIAATLLLFSMGTFVSTAVFYVWPGMKYFRHIGLVTPLVKVLLCFIAGVGFEWLFDAPDTHGARRRCLAGAGCAALLLCAAWLAHDLAGSVSGEFLLVRRLVAAATLSRVAAAFAVGVPLLLAVWPSAYRETARRALLCAVLAFVAVDVYRFKLTYLFAHSNTISAAGRFVTRPAPLTYSRRRVADLRSAALAGAFPRMQAVLAFSPALHARLEGHVTRQAEYWSNNAFFFADEAGSSFRVDSWLKPLDQFMRVNWSIPMDESVDLPAGIDLDRLQFPLDRPATRRLAGVDADKIRFFSRAYRVDATKDLAPLLTDPSFAGNVLFVLPLSGRGQGAPPVPWRSQVPLDRDESRPLAYEVRRFDSNNIVISVLNPTAEPVWLSYADVWHPYWQATVNGHGASVYRGGMAYKAVPLDPGHNVVHLWFRAPAFSVLARTAALNSALWLCLVAWMIMRDVRRS